MKTWKTRIMSAMLALLTLLTLLPTSALAASGSGTGIKATTDPNLWSTRLTSTGQQYSYRPPMAAGKQLYCMDLGYSYRYGTASFLNSYTYQSATGADADALWEKAVAKTGLGEMDAAVKENVKWMMSYIADYTGDIPGSLFMALQTYIWDHQSDKSAGGDTSGDIDAGGFANADTYETYVGYYNWMLAQKAKEDAELQKQIEEYTAQGKQASIVEDMSGKWAVLATSGTAGRQSFFAYHAARKVVTDDKPEGGDNPPPPVAGDGDITFKKVIAGTTHGLDGAVFNIYRDGQIVGSDVTRNGGIIEVKDVTKGLWTFVEVEALEGYALDPTPHSVYVDTTDGDKQYTVSASNSPLPSLKITKADAQTFAKVKATFLVESLTGSYSTTVTVDGEKTLPDLQPGVYRVTEQSVEEPYIKTGTHQDIALLAGAGTVEAAFTNYVKPGLEILKKNIATGEPIAHVTYKIEQIDGSYSTTATTDGAGRIFLANIPVGSYKVTEVNVPSDVILCDIPQTIALGPGETRTVTFFNAMKPSLKIIKRCEVTKAPIPNTKFHIWWASDNTSTGAMNDLGSFYTDDHGEIIFTGDALKSGWYKVTEEAPASGFAPADEPTQEFYLAGNENAVKIWENRPLSALVVFKYDEKTGAALQGAEFQIRYLGGTSGTGGTVIGTYTTSENGSIILTRLKAGTYIVEETKASPFYSIDTPPQTVLLSGKDQDVVTLRFSNQPYGSVLIKKLADDANKTPLAGAAFLVTDDKGTFIGTANGEFTTDKSGAIQLPKLPAGTTIVAKEIRPPEGYALDGTPQTITVQAGENAPLTFYDKPLCNLTILKRDALTKKPLAKAEFIVKDSEGKPIGTDNGRFVTGSDGTVTITALNPNATIIVSEDKAPIGYIKDETPKTIVVRSGVPNSLTFDNEPSTTLVIHKYIEGTENEPLSGVAFKVVDGSGAAVGPDDGVYYTDKAGEIVLNGLEPGTTVVAREIKSVDGFVLDGTPQDILIKAGTVQNLTFWNKRQGALIINKLDAVTKKPLAGVTFKITTATGEFVPDENGKISSNGLYYTDKNGQIILKGVTGTLVVTEEKSIDGYTIDENTRTQTVVVNPDDTQSLCFYNAPIGGVELIKVNAADKTQRIPNTTFEIRRVSDGGLVDTVTTGPDGRVYVPLASDSYYAVETEAGKGYQLDSTPIYFTVEEGKMTTKTVTNKAISGILIHKVNAITGEGIPGVTFLLYDGNHRPIGEYTSDQRGYVYIDDLTESGRFYLRELENEGYVSDTELKTVYVRSGEVTELTWENTPICGQIQVIKKSANDNPINGLPAGTLLEGAVFEITDKAGNVVDTIRTNNRGLAVSKRLPLSRYFVREVKAPEHYGISEKELTVYLEHEGQIVRIETENKSLATGISITKTGPKEIMANQPVRYAFSNIANTSNVSLSNFYWRDTIPAQVRLEKVVTGTYNFPGTYKIVYRVNGGDYRTLADNLSTSKNYTLAASSVALGLASNERVTEIMFVFGQAPAGFSQVEAPYLHCKAVAGLPAGSFVNVADAGGTYNGTWVQAVSRWVTSVYGKPTVPKLPRTGY
ncbi:SpaA isopeptide-forming pilin-related protein [Dysosmobacter segnis]|uniref:SpaA isopeptide-forming pilin-related protein n=2 Tax=Dysosmobacter TaxID=2591381 RepID=UPI001FAB5478|nr:SpaA isopeptide-forming pilin-related protein [Dysosmobacter segnis]